jgi:hypothetical protein
VASDGGRYCLVHALLANAALLRAVSTKSKYQLEMMANDLERRALEMEVKAHSR